MKKIILFSVLICLSAVISFGQKKAEVPNKPNKKSNLTKKIIKPAKVFPGNGYSHAIAVKGGTTIYVAGQIPLNEKGELVGRDDIKAQTQKVFENISEVLKESGATFSDVVKITYFIKNFSPTVLPAIREIRSNFLPKDQPPPTSSLIGVQSLFREDVLIEIEVIAVID